MTGRSGEGEGEEASVEEAKAASKGAIQTRTSSNKGKDSNVWTVVVVVVEMRGLRGVMRRGVGAAFDSSCFSSLSRQAGCEADGSSVSAN